MHEAIDQSCHNEAGCRVPTCRKAVLHASSPENFLSRAYDEQHQQTEHKRILPFLHTIYGIHFGTSKIKKHRREELSKPEYTPECHGEHHSPENIPGTKRDFLPPTGTGPTCEQSQCSSRTCHHHPEIDMWSRPWREQYGPKHGCQDNSGNQLLH